MHFRQACVCGEGGEEPLPALVAGAYSAKAVAP